MKCVQRVCSIIVFLLLIVAGVSPFISLLFNVIMVHGIGAYYTPITITEQSGNALTDYQVKIVLNSTNWDGWNNVGVDGSDIYFMDSNNNVLYYWIELWDYTNKQAIIWVKVPSIPADAQVTIYMYYGGDNPYSSYNNVNQVFDWYENFDTDTTANYVVEKTTSTASVALSVSSSVLTASISGYATDFYIYVNVKSFSPTPGFMIEAREQDPDTVGNSQFGLAVKDDLGNLWIWKYIDADATNFFDLAFRYNGNALYDEAITTDTNWHVMGLGYYNDNWYLYYDNVLKSTIASAISGTSVYIGLQGGNQVGAQINYDYIIVRKFVDPEPSISIGSSVSVNQGSYPWFTASVEPNSVSVQPSQSISFDVNVTNTGYASGWVVVELRDHSNITRDSANVTLDVNQSTIITLSTTATADDRGDWTWHIIGHNDTTTFFNISVSVSIHYSLSYSYNYNIQLGSNLNASSVSGIRYNYTVNASANVLADMVSGNGYDKVWGTKYSLVIYTNSSGAWSIVYEESGATVYTLYVRFVYNVTAPYPDVPDASVKVYDADSGELLSTIYVPHGNTSMTLYANRYYRFEIPEAGPTLHGYCFVLSKYDVNGVTNPASILLDRDSVLTIYYDIVNGTCTASDPYGASFSTINIATVGSRVGVYSFTGQIYGGDVYDGYQKIVNGLIDMRNISSNWINFGSYDSILIQYYSPVSTPVKGAGFYEGGNYYVVGYYMNVTGTDTRIIGGRFLVDPAGTMQRIIYAYQDAWLENYQSYEHYAKLVFYKGNVLAMIYADGQWYRLAASLNNTAVSYAVFIGNYYPSNILIMRGDYIVFQAPGLKAVEIIGVDAAGNPVNIAVADNAPGDADPREGVIMIQELPVLYPLNATIKLYMEASSASISYNMPGIASGQWIDISWNNISVSSSNSSLVNSVVGILSNDYGRIILGLLPIIMLLWPNRKYGAIMGLFAVGTMGFFNIIAISNGYGAIIDPSALVLSFIVLVFGILYETK